MTIVLTVEVAVVEIDRAAQERFGWNRGSMEPNLI
jgi:hypothetical protein